MTWRPVRIPVPSDRTADIARSAEPVETNPSFPVLEAEYDPATDRFRKTYPGLETYIVAGWLMRRHRRYALEILQGKHYRP